MPTHAGTRLLPGAFVVVSLNETSVKPETSLATAEHTLASVAAGSCQFGNTQVVAPSTVPTA